MTRALVLVSLVLWTVTASIGARFAAQLEDVDTRVAQIEEDMDDSPSDECMDDTIENEVAL